jgi:hypothetical protein
VRLGRRKGLAECTVLAGRSRRPLTRHIRGHAVSAADDRSSIVSCGCSRDAEQPARPLSGAEDSKNPGETHISEEGQG